MAEEERRAGTALVTGVSGALGGVVARRLAADGWRVVAPVRPRASGALPDLPAGAIPVSADVTDEADMARAAERAAGDPSLPLRAVVNLVGGFAVGGRVHETPVEQFEAQLRLNLRSAYVTTAAALPYLIAAGGGSVVCTSSRAAVRPFAGAAGYIVAKGALLHFVDALAVEYRDYGIRVNAVLPSVIDTPANRARQTGTSRYVSPEEVADVIAFLCSDASRATSGAHIPVYGDA